MLKEISVVIPVYNAEKALKKTIESILKQKYFERTELILIDDGSTDNSNAICQSYSEKYNNIVVQRISNSGVSHARNVGKNLAAGQYIWFVDADDYISEDAFEKLFEVTEKKRYDVIYFNNVFEQVDGSVISYPIKNITEKIEYSQQDIRQKIIPWVLGDTDKQKHVFEYARECGAITYSDCYNAPWQALYKRDYINSISFDEELNIYEDLLFNFEVLLSASSLFYIAEPLYHYVSSANGLATKYHKNYGDMKLHLYHSMVSLMNVHGIDYETQHLLGYRIQSEFISLFVNECKNRNKKEALQRIKHFFSDELINKAFLCHKKNTKAYEILNWLILHKLYAVALFIVSVRTGGN